MVAELAQDLQLKPDDVTKKLVRVSVDIFVCFYTCNYETTTNPKNSDLKM